MSNRPTGQKKLPKKDRKALARELARLERERHQARRRRNRRLAWTGVGATVVVAGAVVAMVIQSSIRAGQYGPHNMLSDGVVLSGADSTISVARTSALAPDADPVATQVDRTSGVVDLGMYLDYRDPDAQTFWAANGESIRSWVGSGYATFEIHPLALLDDDEAGDYSARAANALACVADTQPDVVLDAHDALLAAQPDLPETGLDDAAVLATIQNAGITDQTVADCLGGHDFAHWVRQATARATSGASIDPALDTSPVILVAGEQYTGALDDPDALLAFIEEVSERLAAEAEVAGGAGAEATAEPTAVPTAEATTDPDTEVADGTDSTDPVTGEDQTGTD